MEKEHVGRPIVRTIDNRVLVLCPVGHLVETMPLQEWAGSGAEARCGDPDYRVTCSGTVR